MNFAVAIAIVLLIIGVISARFASSQTSTSVSSEQSNLIPTPTVKPNSQEKKDQISLPQPTPTLKPTPQATQPPSTSDVENQEWYYPNAQINKINGNEAKLITADDPSLVTQWYEDKINKMGFSAVSIVITSANENTQNKLSAANDDRKVEVAIERKDTDTTTTIILKISS